ncbi:CoA transferase [Allopusillimonas soli]|uniref:CoA transferase n=1 Tax=Allopusillimonas soli TaxID=659016 RepID=A0A853F600_9BURK|nr:CoA transferase [Allopusillimonas soli]NYT35409.1 CoA transferase [Allopusillimonas soli]
MSATHTLADETRQAVDALLDGQHWANAQSSQRLHFHGHVPAFDSAHKLTVSAASAIGAYALGVEQWWHMAHGQHQSVALDWMQAACSLNPGHFQKQSGYVLPALSLLTELKADFYRTQDARWFFPIGSYPHLRDGVLDLLQCANTAEALANAIGKWEAHALEEAFAERKLPGIYARSAQEWLDHPQGRLLAGKPVIEVEKIGDSEAEAPRACTRPLDGIRVLDLGHVIAGPIVARSLAEHGADVLRVTSPTIQDPFRQTVDTNIGKRSAFLDFDRPVDLARARELISGADVVVQSWRPGSLKARGLGAEDAAAIRPGVIYVTVTAFGDDGPWGARGGFEQLGQAVSGVAVNEGGNGKPSVVPTYLLNDYLTGYLGAAGVMMALIRRAAEGGSYHVRISLARTSMWVQSLGLEPGYTPGQPRRHFADNLAPMLETRDSAYGPLEQLPPVAQFSHTPASWRLPPAPNGAHFPQWLKP